ncbi:respiratory nitrate reductase subunit gamma [Thauera sp. CAU 1555]|uniref:Respiratory nitrate reductase subunit gamma n=1 Tax=Thauera sedimentorum TaxID=2767595 RepID=A0ABR9B7D5_9RHOO|nr:respiratory nitrate reductase subunit gamma [Thauera sedimentorum]MBC9071187.1 respiratory nitrate reductase subunit gamma [Thauera sedimentorum]MBD8502106.1 respiratory nitrate reductase subunit gamma [Thauera sedimentorum]
MNLLKLIFGVYPYIALTVFFVGSWIRYDNEQYTWKTDSSMLLSKRHMVLASNLFHVGIISIFLGHFAGLVMPHAFWLALGVSDMAHQWLAIVAGSVFGTMCLIGAVILWLRRVFNPRIRAASRYMDNAILTLILITLLLGLSTLPVSIGHASHGNPDVMLALAGWVNSIITLDPQPELLAKVEPVFRLHMFLGMTVFLLFPFSRLVHVWTAPFTYMGRAYQIVRSKRRVRASV